MNEVWIALIGVTGTLSAALLAGRMQRIAYEKAEERADRRRLVDQRAEALSAFASSVVDHRRTELRRWHEAAAVWRQGNHIETEHVASAEEARRARSAAWARYYHLRVLWGDRDISLKAEALLHVTSKLEDAGNEDQLKTEADKVREQLGELADDARLRLDDRGL